MAFWSRSSATRRRLERLPVRLHDRVLMVRAANWPEHVVTGVIDGFVPRPELRLDTKTTIPLERDEAVRVVAVDGTELIEVRQGEGGPVVRLLSEGVDLEIPGKFRLAAKEIALEATQGPARVDATDDFIVKAEVIRLN